MSLSRARVIGLGQALAGDDGAGLAVIARLRQHALARATELVTLSDVSQLMELLCDVELVWIVDAVELGDRVGEVVELELGELSARASCSASSHGLDVAQAITLGCELYPERTAPRIRILGLAVDVHSLRHGLPEHGQALLSPAVERAVDEAVRLILATLPRAEDAKEVVHARE